MPPPDADVPREVAAARRMARHSRQLVRQAARDERALRGLLEREGDRLDPMVAEAAERLRAKLREQRQEVEQVAGAARRHRDFVEQELRPSDDQPPRLPRELLRPDGQPWWPQRPPPPQLQPEQMLVMPVPGASFL
mmetsp:Transcript_31491/g.96780  ORF Transcript_31491/g.96780 Transcript_31491/m.96780 type:complete len:136 (+) Transcript_31491:1-408(+)